MTPDRCSLVLALSILWATVPCAGSPDASTGARAGSAPALESNPRFVALESAVAHGPAALAESLATALLPEVARTYGNGSPEVAVICDRLTEACYEQGPSRALVPLNYSCARAMLAIRERTPVDSSQLSHALQRFGRCLRERQEPDSALAPYRRAIAIEELRQGADSWAVSTLLNSFAKCQRLVGDYAGLRASLERSLAIRRALRPLDASGACLIESNLAITLMEMGDYAPARGLLGHVLAVYESLAVHDPNYAIKVGEQTINMGQLLASMGDFAAARDTLERSVAIHVRTLGARHHETAEAMMDLGDVQLDLGDTLSATTTLEQALEIARATLPADHPDIAFALRRLGELALGQGHLDVARSRLTESLAIGERTQGPNHPDVAVTLGALATVDRLEAAFDQARARLDRSLAITRTAFGPGHPSEAVLHLERAALAYDRGDGPTALSEALEAERIGASHLRMTARTLPEPEALRYARHRAAGLDLALSALAAAPSPAAAESVWDALVRSRALVLDEMALRHRTMIAVTDTLAHRQWDQAIAARRRMAQLAFAGPGSTDPAVYRALLEHAERAADEAERVLARTALPYAAARAHAEAGLADVRAGLPNGAALVAFARYRAWSRGAMAADERDGRYLAFVLSPGAAVPTVVPLGGAASIDSLIDAWRSAVEPGAVEAGPSRAERARREGDRLRARLWDPIAPAVRGANLILTVPDGALDLVDLAALPEEGSATRYLVERGQPFHYLSAERDLVARPQEHRSAGWLAMGGADFEHDRPQPVLPSESTGAPLAYRGPAPACADFTGLRFEALPGSAREVEEIAGLLAERDGARRLGRVLTGAAADEGAFKRLAPGGGIVHVATHGFFLDDHCGVNAGMPQEVAENPLLRSGFALAGANHRDRCDATSEDGIVTADEIASLDLTGTQWLVLSACHSGIGEPTAGEGILGLRRAVETAGAHTLILGLWRVDDAASRRWMRALYRARFEHHEDTAHAVMDASLEVLAERRRRGLDVSPAEWAPFIATGDWR